MDPLPASPTTENIRLPSTEFICRACLAVLFALAAHQFHWEGLRFITSEAILRTSALLGMTAARTAVDTVEVQGQLLQIVLSCTFVELFLASLPLIWRLDSSPIKNLMNMAAVGGALCALNIFRLEIAVLAISRGVPWILAHDIPLGFAYFAVWAAVWRTRNWPAWQVCTRGWGRCFP